MTEVTSSDKYTAVYTEQERNVGMEKVKRKAGRESKRVFLLLHWSLYVCNVRVPPRCVFGQSSAACDYLFFFPVSL